MGRRGIRWRNGRRWCPLCRQSRSCRSGKLRGIGGHSVGRSRRGRRSGMRPTIDRLHHRSHERRLSGRRWRLHCHLPWSCRSGKLCRVGGHSVGMGGRGAGQLSGRHRRPHCRLCRGHGLRHRFLLRLQPRLHLRKLRLHRRLLRLHPRRRLRRLHLLCRHSVGIGRWRIGRLSGRRWRPHCRRSRLCCSGQLRRIGGPSVRMGRRRIGGLCGHRWRPHCRRFLPCRKRSRYLACCLRGLPCCRSRRCPSRQLRRVGSYSMGMDRRGMGRLRGHRWRPHCRRSRL